MRYIIPHTVDEALNQLCGTEKIKCIAGGTDLAIILADTRHHIGTADPAKINLIKLGWDKDILI